jgi:hypothetical protein
MSKRKSSPFHPGLVRAQASGRFEISQQLLEELFELNESMKQLRSRYEKLRTDLLALADRGAVVSSGAFVLDIQRVEQRRFNVANLTAILGRAGMEKLQNQIKPVEITRVTVQKKGKSGRSVQSIAVPEGSLPDSPSQFAYESQGDEDVTDGDNQAVEDAEVAEPPADRQQTI